MIDNKITYINSDDKRYVFQPKDIDMSIIKWEKENTGRVFRLPKRNVSYKFGNGETKIYDDLSGWNWNDAKQFWDAQPTEIKNTLVQQPTYISKKVDSAKRIASSIKDKLLSVDLEPMPDARDIPIYKKKLEKFVDNPAVNLVAGIKWPAIIPVQLGYQGFKFVKSVKDLDDSITKMGVPTNKDFFNSFWKTNKPKDLPTAGSFRSEFRNWAKRNPSVVGVVKIKGKPVSITSMEALDLMDKRQGAINQYMGQSAKSMAKAFVPSIKNLKENPIPAIIGTFMAGSLAHKGIRGAAGIAASASKRVAPNFTGAIEEALSRWDQAILDRFHADFPDKQTETAFRDFGTMRDKVKQEMINATEPIGARVKGKSIVVPSEKNPSKLVKIPYVKALDHINKWRVGSNDYLRTGRNPGPLQRDFDVTTYIIKNSPSEYATLLDLSNELSDIAMIPARAALKQGVLSQEGFNRMMTGAFDAHGNPTYFNTSRELESISNKINPNSGVSMPPFKKKVGGEQKVNNTVKNTILALPKQLRNIEYNKLMAQLVRRTVSQDEAAGLYGPKGRVQFVRSEPVERLEKNMPGQLADNIKAAKSIFDYRTMWDNSTNQIKSVSPSNIHPSGAYVITAKKIYRASKGMAITKDTIKFLRAAGYDAVQVGDAANSLDSFFLPLKRSAVKKIIFDPKVLKQYGFDVTSEEGLKKLLSTKATEYIRSVESPPVGPNEIAIRVSRPTYLKGKSAKTPTVDIDEVGNAKVNFHKDPRDVWEIWKFHDDRLYKAVNFYRNKAHQKDLTLEMVRNEPGEAATVALAKTANLSKRVLQKSVSLSFEFMARNFQRDFQTGIGLDYTIPKDTIGMLQELTNRPFEWIGALKDTTFHSRLDKQIRDKGAQYSTFYAKHPNIDRHYRDNFIGKRSSIIYPVEWAKGIPRNVLGLLEKATSTIEKTNRQLVANRVYAKTGSVDEAARAYADLPNFSLHGWAMDGVGDYVPFLTASLSGFRSIRNAYIKDPVSTFNKIYATSTIPDIYLWAKYHDKAWYQATPPDIRDRYYVLPPVKIGGEVVNLRWPKPFDVAMVSNFTINGMNEAYKKDPKTMNEWIRSFINKRGISTISQSTPMTPPPWLIGLMGVSSGVDIRTMKQIVNKKGVNKALGYLDSAPFTTSGMSELHRTTGLNPDIVKFGLNTQMGGVLQYSIERAIDASAKGYRRFKNLPILKEPAVELGDKYLVRVWANRDYKDSPWSNIMSDFKGQYVSLMGRIKNINDLYTRMDEIESGTIVDPAVIDDIQQTLAKEEGSLLKEYPMAISLIDNYGGGEKWVRDLNNKTNKKIDDLINGKFKKSKDMPGKKLEDLGYLQLKSPYESGGINPIARRNAMNNISREVHRLATELMYVLSVGSRNERYWNDMSKQF